MFRVIRYGGSIGEVNHPYECKTKEEAQAKAKADKKAQNKKSDKRYKATKVSSEQVEALANAIVEAGMAKEELAQQNRKVLIQVMKKLHCKMWYRTYDKATMVSKIATALA